MPRLVAKANHDVTITHTVETMIVLYPIETTTMDSWDYTGGESEDIYDTAEQIGRDGQAVYQGDDGNEYLESEIEWVEDDDD